MQRINFLTTVTTGKLQGSLTGKHTCWNSVNLTHFSLACPPASVRCTVACALMPSLVCLRISPAVAQPQARALLLCSHPSHRHQVLSSDLFSFNQQVWEFSHQHQQRGFWLWHCGVTSLLSFHARLWDWWSSCAQMKFGIVFATFKSEWSLATKHIILCSAHPFNHVRKKGVWETHSHVVRTAQWY